MNVCMVVPYFPPVYSGAGQLVYDFGRRLPEQDVKVRIIALDTGGLPREERMDGMHVVRIRPWSQGRLKHASLMHQLFWLLWRYRREYQVLHLHGAYFPLFGVTPFVRLLGKKTVLTFHDAYGDIPESIPHRAWGSLQLKFLNTVDRFIHTSSLVADSFAQTGLPLEKLRRIPCGIDVEQRFLPVDKEKKMALRRERGLDPEAKIVVFAGAMVREKGLDLLVEAWARVAEACPGARLLLIGPLDLTFRHPDQAEFLENLKKRMDHLGLQDSVQMTGRVDGIESYLQLADIFVFASRYETFGIALIEAMACGLPPVVTTIQGVSTDIVDHQQNGLLVEQEDVEGFADAVLQLLGDEATREKMGQRATEKVRQEFSIASVSRKHRELYEELLS
jgi:glycosyltransferase involved in cell wall biosynthesis